MSVPREFLSRVRIPRLGYLGWVMIFVVVLVVLALCLRLYCWTEGDLRQVEAEARAMGIPPTWEEAGLGHRNPQALLRFEELQRLSERIPSWSGRNILYRIGVPLPPEFLALQASIPPNDWADVLECLEHLPSQSVVLYETPQQAMGHSRGWNPWGQIFQVMSQRCLIISPDDIPKWVSAMAQVARAAQIQGTIDSYVSVESISRILRDVSYRLPDLRGTEMGQLTAKELSKIRETLWKNRTHGLRAQLAQIEYYPERVMKDQSRRASGGWQGELESTQRTAVFVMYHLLVRYQRAEVMRDALVCIQTVQQAENPSDLLRRVRALKDSNLRVANFMGPSYGWMFSKVVQNLLTCDVLISELQGSPMPIDYCDPAAGPLHPVERAGNRIGWYSVGINGIDDGGEKGNSTTGDFAIPTAGVFGEKHFADELNVEIDSGIPPGFKATAE